MIRRARYRAAFLLTMASVLLAALETRLFSIQILGRRSPEECAAYRIASAKETGARGAVLDGRGGVLARSVTSVNVFAWSKDVFRREELAAHLERLAGIPVADTLKKLAEEPWARLAENLKDPDVIRELRKLSRRLPFRAVHIEEAHHRTYPQGELFSPLLGFVDHEGIGRAGLEQKYDALLQPETGERWFLRDGRNREMPGPDGSELADHSGRTIQLTLDPLIQREAELALDSLMEEFHPVSAQALVLDPRSGEILALGQRPAPPAGRPQTEAAVKDYHVLPLEAAYAPGSTFKPLMMALALDQGSVDLSRPIDCEHGLAYFGRRPVTDVDGGYGLLTPGEVLIHSSNVGMAKLVRSLVPEEAPRGHPAFQKVLDFLAAMGFGQRCLELAGEATGLVTPLERFTLNYTLVSLSYGYEIAVTPVQMAAAAAAVVNGGHWIRPRLLRGVVDEDGRLQEAPWEARRVLEHETSVLVRSFLEQVVEQGSTGKYRPRGYSMGGKTGTAEKEQNPEQISPSYFCFGPVAEPELLVLVVVDEPDHGRFASEIAAPAAAHLYGEALRLRKIRPDREAELAPLVQPGEGDGG